jgi:AraC-like DNA-binding protein
MAHSLSDALTPVEFSTVGLPVQRRIELWEGHNAEALIGLRCRTLDAAALEATEVNVQLDWVHLARVTGSSHVVERDGPLIRGHPAEAIALYFSLTGDAFFYHEGGVLALRPGQMLMCDADRPFMRGFSQGLEELVVKVPRRTFADLAGADGVRVPVVVDFAKGGNPYAHALAWHVGRAARLSEPVPADERTVLELVSVLAAGGRDGFSAAHRAAARAYIGSHLSENGLSAAQIAEGIGISARHLSRIFAEDGTSVPRYVLGRRLDAAHAMLQKSRATPMSVAEIARQCGFMSVAHFSNAFAARFGERASDVRRKAVAARGLTLA